MLSTVLTRINRANHNPSTIVPQPYPVAQSNFLTIRIFHLLTPTPKYQLTNGSIGIEPGGSPEGGTAPIGCQKHLHGWGEFFGA